MKDLFGKAKKKILSDENENLDNLLVPKVQIQVRNDNIHPISGIRTDIYTGFTPAPSNSNHFTQFKSKVTSSFDKLLKLNKSKLEGTLKLRYKKL